jgi:LmbE family N-acetylglucosaminyl deacetylase
MNNPYHLRPVKTEEISIEGNTLRLDPGEGPVLLEAAFRRSIWHPGEAWIEISADGKTAERQYFGKTLKDFCYVDLSGITAPCSIRITTAGITLDRQARLLHFSKISNEGVTLIIAPHPDDGELACTSFYGRNTYLVTLSAGEKIQELRKQYFKSMDKSLEEAGRRKGLLRAFNASTVPLLGGIPYDQMVCLGYRDGFLEEMINGASVSSPYRPGDFRIYNSGTASQKLGLLEDPDNSAEDLRTELGEIIKRIKPARILVTNPFLEFHRDHLAAGKLILNMSREGTTGDADILFYSIHAQREKDPYFGPAGSRITLPSFAKTPEIDQSVHFSYVSNNLTEEDMKKKAVMMNCMYDLYSSKDHRWRPSRILEYLDSPRIGKAYYFRRFIKANEIFLKLEK